MGAEIIIAERIVKFWFSNAEIKELYFCSFFSFLQKKQLFYFVRASPGALKLLLWGLFFPINPFLCFVASNCFKTLWLMERRCPVPNACRHPIKPHSLVLAEPSCLDSDWSWCSWGSMPRIFYLSQEHSCSPGSLRDTALSRRDHFLSTKIINTGQKLFHDILKTKDSTPKQFTMCHKTISEAFHQSIWKAHF